MRMRFDIFTVRQWQEGYTLHVDIARPHNAPRHKFTRADGKRACAASKKNLELVGRMFGTLEEVFEEIKCLQFPMKEADTEGTEKEN